MRILALAILIFASSITSSWSITLRDVLTEHGFDHVSLSDLDLAILGPEISDTEDYFSVGYFVDATDPEIHVVLFDRKNKQWFKNEIKLEGTEFCFGSNAITGIQYSKKFVHLETHINPSAGCTLIFTKKLRFQKALYGWPLATFADETVVYHNSVVHFAPTHPAAISMYNPVTKYEKMIYPMKPYQDIRLRHIKKMKELYSDTDWCRERNHHCDPESFNDSIGDLEINNKSNSLIFQAHFSGDYWKDPKGLNEESHAVIYVYRHVKDAQRIEYKEILEKDLKKKFGDHPLSDYLQPEILSQIFGSE